MASGFEPISKSLLPAEEVLVTPTRQGGNFVGPYPLAPGESWARCPYDDNHIIRNSRYHIHLVKCQRIYVQSYTARIGSPPKMLGCRFNQLHQMYGPELAEHEKECSDRPPYEYYAAKFNNGRLETTEDYKFVEHLAKLEKKEEDLKLEKQFAEIKKDNEERAQAKLLEKKDNEDEEEDWEKEDTGKMFQYDPYRLESLDGKRILCRPISGLCKSERKAIRKKFQVKFGILSEDGIVDGNAEYNENASDPEIRFSQTNQNFEEVKHEDEGKDEEGKGDDIGDPNYVKLTMIPRSEFIKREKVIQ